MRTYKTEFPDFDNELTFPDGWIDTSWHNDICPSFEKDFGNVTYKIFCDYKNPEKREVGGDQFTISLYYEDAVNFACIAQFNTLQEALDFVNKETSK
jgi:hypothetical protein